MRIAREQPHAKTILDVACGTGEHARLLPSDFEVDSIDLEPKFVEIARAKNRQFICSRHFQAAGLRCVFDAVGLFDRGLFIALALDPTEETIELHASEF
jgi:SAM-dependent methyltransferase